jgi:predicted O-methyltransferase YrrM
VTSVTTPDSFEAALAAVDGVRGWLTPAQGQELYKRAAQVPAGKRIVEIGSFHGKSTIFLASAAAAGVEVVAIDPHPRDDLPPDVVEGLGDRPYQDAGRFLENLDRTGLRERVTYVHARSVDALDQVPGNVCLLFIDGDHRYRPALDDITRWGARVEENGVMFVHDSFCDTRVTVAQFVALGLSREFRYVGRIGSLAAYVRTNVGSAGRVRNLFGHVWGLTYLFRNVVIKLLITLRLARLTRYLGNPSGEWPY